MFIIYSNIKKFYFMIKLFTHIVTQNKQLLIPQVTF
jgi:hypothetical protein